MPKEKKEPTTDVIEYDITIVAIDELRQEYSGMKITDAASDKTVRAARTFMVSKRTAVEKRRIELNDEANKHRRRVNEKAKELTVLLLPIEEPLQAEVKRVDDERETEKAEKARLEEERVEDIRAKIHKIQEMAMPTVLGTMALENLRELSSRLEDMEIKETEYMESTEEARKVQDDAYNAVQDAITARIKLDNEEARRRAEAEQRLAKIQLDQEAAQKLLNEAAARHQAKVDEDNRKIKKAQQKIDDEKAKIEADKKAAREKVEFDEKMKDLKAQADKEAKEAQEQIERDKSAKATAQAAEKARQEALAPDMDKLTKWIESFNETAIPSPQLKSKEAKEIYRIAREQIEIILQEVMDKIEEL